jgi:twitching motility two-component system response regulator PilG
VIPVFTPQQLRAIDNPQVKDHFTKLVDGRASLLNIAEKMGKDPITVAKNYLNWANKGWVSFVDSPLEAKTDVAASVANIQGNVQGVSTSINSAEAISLRERSAIAKIDHDLPVVLSVDDSAIIQTSIKRALQEDYNVLLAGKATEALEILQEVKVELMLLDLTMPDVDGLEFCKTVRAIPQFRDLPIVMVTARDGLVNKMRGHIAGTSKYLTKPFKPEELREVVRQYIK